MPDKETKQATSIMVRVLHDVRVVAEMHQWWGAWQVSKEEHAKRLERAVKDFENFLRDHRSQDAISLTVEQDYRDECSVCRCEWELGSDENGLYCAGCGAPVSSKENDDA